jgi:hypothetical protein
MTFIKKKTSARKSFKSTRRYIACSKHERRTMAACIARTVMCCAQINVWETEIQRNISDIL